jgi:hypothetical protein
MYLFEFEKIEIVLDKIDKRWINKIGEYEINKPILVDWKLIKTTTFRTKFMNVKCDDCGLIHERRLRDLDVNNNIHYCKKCCYSGEKNYNYGKSQSEGSKIGLKRWRSENTNPFTWDSSKKKIREHPSFTQKYEKIRGQKRTQEVKDKMSKSAIESFKSGKRKVSNGWGNVKMKTYKGINYQSTYELKFIKFIESIGMLNIIDRGPIILYFDNTDKEHTYHSDFTIIGTDLVFEVKSSYTWKKNLEINLLKKAAAEKNYNYNLVIDNNFNKISQILDEYKKI